MSIEDKAWPKVIYQNALVRMAWRAVNSGPSYEFIEAFEGSSNSFEVADRGVPSGR